MPHNQVDVSAEAVTVAANRLRNVRCDGLNAMCDEAADMLDALATARDAALGVLAICKADAYTSGLSWAGKNIVGDKVSIEYVKKAVHYFEQMETLRDAWKERLDAVDRERDEIAEALHERITRWNDAIAERDAAMRERDEAKAEWPEWARKILAMLCEYGWRYDADEPIDIAAEVRSWGDDTDAACRADVERAHKERDAAVRERDAARDEAYELRLAILGGEDVPGLAGSIPLSEVKSLHEKYLLSQQWRAETAEAERAAAAAALAKAEGALRHARKCILRNADLHTKTLARFDLVEAVYAIDAALTPNTEAKS